MEYSVTNKVKEEDIWLTPKDIEKKLQLSHATVSKLINTKGFPVVRIGRNIRVKPSDLDEFLSSYKSHTIHI